MKKSTVKKLIIIGAVIAAFFIGNYIPVMAGGSEPILSLSDIYSLFQKHDDKLTEIDKELQTLKAAIATPTPEPTPEPFTFDIPIPSAGIVSNRIKIMNTTFRIVPVSYENETCTVKIYMDGIIEITDEEVLKDATPIVDICIYAKTYDQKPSYKILVPFDAKSGELKNYEVTTISGIKSFAYDAYIATNCLYKCDEEWLKEMNPELNKLIIIE